MWARQPLKTDRERSASLHGNDAESAFLTICWGSFSSFPLKVVLTAEQNLGSWFGTQVCLLPRLADTERSYLSLLPTLASRVLAFWAGSTKNSHNLKAEGCPKMGIFRTLSLGNCISNNPERTILRKWGEEPGNVQVFNKGQVNEHQEITVN